ncbi:MAG: DNA alkylation repair protein [Candidatus Obscuribacterales bacterium]|nr:DNA alkylation repair protein [Candidatus Obscuribacterales bacterium]
MSTQKAATTSDIIKFVTAQLEQAADPSKAPEMAAYMKTDMPFYGVQKPDREPILRAIKKVYRPKDRREYEATIRQLWNLHHREEKYIALGYATIFVDLAAPGTLDLFEELVRDGAWWDFVDVIASHLVGHLLKSHRAEISPIMDVWVDDEDVWIRRTAILSQLKHKKNTDSKRLFSYCLKRADEKEFFIRKAIGWALREYSYANPEAVHRFIVKNKDRLSGLSVREGAKQLVKAGWTV